MAQVRSPKLWQSLALSRRRHRRPHQGRPISRYRENTSRDPCTACIEDLNSKRPLDHAHLLPMSAKGGGVSRKVSDAPAGHERALLGCRRVLARPKQSPRTAAGRRSRSRGRGSTSRAAATPGTTTRSRSGNGGGAALWRTSPTKSGTRLWAPWSAAPTAGGWPWSLTKTSLGEPSSATQQVTSLLTIHVAVIESRMQERTGGFAAAGLCRQTTCPTF